MVRSGSSLPQFFKDLTAAIGCMRHEREQALLTALTKSAFGTMLPIQCRHSSAVPSHLMLRAWYCSSFSLQRQTSNSCHRLSLTACFGSYAGTVGLPCRHMLAHRKSQGSDIFTLEGIWPRWLKADALSSQRGMCTTSGQTTGGTRVAQQTQRTLTLSEKFQRCKRLGQHLIALACEGGTEQFHSRFAAMQRLVSVWEKGEIAVITSGQDITGITTVCK